MVLALLLACARSPGDPLPAAQRFLATRPLYEQPLADGLQIPAGLTSLSAASCGACHAQIYADWRLSTHAHAWVDRQLQAEMTKSENRWLCQNCHTPLQVQHAQIPTGLVDEDVERPIWADNPHYDAALQAEGVTCAACHVRDGVIVGPTGAPTDAHPTRQDPTFKSADLCLRCHQAVAEYPGKTFVCTFRTGEEWAAGPYRDVPCQGCHMPTADTAEVATQASGPRRHWFAGSGIPQGPGVSPPDSALPPGLTVVAGREGDQVVATVTNAIAGHNVPTGDPERFVTVQVTFYGPDGQTLGAQTERIGQTWEWWPTPRKLGDNRLAPGERRRLSWAVPAGARSATLVATRHRMTEEAAAYHQLDGYPLSDEFWTETLTW